MKKIIVIILTFISINIYAQNANTSNLKDDLIGEFAIEPNGKAELKITKNNGIYYGQIMEGGNWSNPDVLNDTNSTDLEYLFGKDWRNFVEVGLSKDLFGVFKLKKGSKAQGRTFSTGYFLSYLISGDIYKLNTGHTQDNKKTNEISNKNEELRKKKILELIQIGDWKTKDISELDLKPSYFEAVSIPLFENSINEFSVLKKCDNCRNDNIISIEKSLQNSIKKSNRYTISNKENFAISSNINKLEILVEKINFQHNGLDDEGKDKGFTCRITYTQSFNTSFESPQKYTNASRKTKTVKSNIWNTYSNKREAFNNTLLELEKQFKEIIYKYESISLDIISIEVDKKGVPEFLVLSNNSYLFDKKKIYFYVVEKSSMAINNNKFSANVIAEIVYNKSDFPNIIKAKIKKKKTKKLLEKYLGKEDEIITFSNSK